MCSVFYPPNWASFLRALNMAEIAAAEPARPSSAAASVPAGSAADFVCPFVDLETQNVLASRLLGCLANQTVLQKRSAEDGAQRLRLMLLPDDKDRKKKGGLTLAALGERVSQAEAKASKTSLGHEGFTTKLFTSRDELQCDTPPALHPCVVEARSMCIQAVHHVHPGSGTTRRSPALTRVASATRSALRWRPSCCAPGMPRRRCTAARAASCPARRRRSGTG